MDNPRTRRSHVLLYLRANSDAGRGDVSEHLALVDHHHLVAHHVSNNLRATGNNRHPGQQQRARGMQSAGRRGDRQAARTPLCVIPGGIWYLKRFGMPDAGIVLGSQPSRQPSTKKDDKQHVLVLRKRHNTANPILPCRHTTKKTRCDRVCIFKPMGYGRRVVQVVIQQQKGHATTQQHNTTAPVRRKPSNMSGACSKGSSGKKVYQYSTIAAKSPPTRRCFGALETHAFPPILGYSNKQTPSHSS